MTFEENIQKWVILDNQLKSLSEKMKEIREKKSKLQDDIYSYAENNDLTNRVIQISDGKLKFASTRVASSLTFKYVERALGEIIKNEGQVKQIVEYLKQNREIHVVPEIKRYG